MKIIINGVSVIEIRLNLKLASISFDFQFRKYEEFKLENMKLVPVREILSEQGSVFLIV